MHLARRDGVIRMVGQAGIERRDDAAMTDKMFGYHLCRAAAAFNAQMQCDFLLCQSRVNVQRERIDIGASTGRLRDGLKLFFGGLWRRFERVGARKGWRAGQTRQRGRMARGGQAVRFDWITWGTCAGAPAQTSPALPA